MHAGRAFCEKYAGWLQRNQVRAAIMNPLDLDYIADEHEKRTRVQSTVSDDVEIAELVDRVRERLPVELQEAFLKMQVGARVPRAKRQKVEDAVREILKGDLECRNGDA